MTELVVLGVLCDAIWSIWWHTDSSGCGCTTQTALRTLTHATIISVAAHAVMAVVGGYGMV